MGPIKLILLSTLMAVIAYISYNVFIVDPELNWKLKALSAAVKCAYIISGMYPGAPYRNLNMIRNRETVDAIGNFSTGVFSEDILVPSHNEKNLFIPVRVFIPEGIEKQKGLGLKFPVLLYIHGGGFVFGSPFSKMYHNFCEILAERAQVIVISIDYRLAPEHPFPAAPEDCYSVLKWTLSNNNKYLGLINTKKIFLAGDSAGGNLVPNLNLMARDRKLTSISYQIPIYPSMVKGHHDGGYLLPVFVKDFFLESYLPNPLLRKEKYVNPLTDTTIGVPPTFVITAEYDPLKSEGIEYIELLKKGGVEVKHKNFKSVHGFLLIPMPEVQNEAKEALDDIINELKARSK